MPSGLPGALRCVPASPSSPSVMTPSLQQRPYHLQDGLPLQSWASPRSAWWPGWKRTSRFPRAGGVAICQPPSRDGGSYVQPGLCRHSAGWQGDICQTDMDKCSAGGGTCTLHCVSTMASYRCQKGQSPSADGVLCLPKSRTPREAPNPTTGMDSAVEEEVRMLQSRMDVLEEKGQLVLPHCTARPQGPGSTGCLTPADSPVTPSSSWTASALCESDLLPGGAAGLLFLQEGAVTDLAQVPGSAYREPVPTELASAPPPLPVGPWLRRGTGALLAGQGVGGTSEGSGQGKSSVSL